MMASDPRSNQGASVTEVDFRSGQTVDGGDAAHPDAPGGEFQPPVRYDDYGWQAPPAEQPARSSGRLLQVGASLVAVAGFVAVVWFAYHWGLERGYRQEIQIVRAEQGPIKVRPENPGGLVVPNQDKLVLNEVPNGDEAPGVERLLSAPETPKLPPATIEALIESTEDKSVAEGEAAQQPAAAEPEAESPEVPAIPEAAPSAAESAAPEPAAPEPAVPEPAAPETAEAAPATKLEVPAPSTDGELSATSSSGAADVEQPATGGGGESGAAGQVQVASIEDGDYVIQLASVNSDGAAEQEWGRLQRTFPNLLGDMKLAVQRATVKGTEYHRVQTGPFPSRATALDMCAQMKIKNQPCIVQQR